MMKEYNKKYAELHEQDSNTYWEYKEIFRLFMPKKQDKIFEVGCNTGDLLSLLEQKGHIASGIDVNKNAIMLAKKKFHGKVQVRDVMDLTEIEKFDVIYALHVIEHIEDTQRFLKKMKNKLKQNGTLILSCPNKWAYLMRLEHFLQGKKHCYDATHKKYFSIKKLKKECETAGFKVINKSTLPLDLITQLFLEKFNIRIPCGFFGGHNYIVVRK